MEGCKSVAQDGRVKDNIPIVGEMVNNFTNFNNLDTILAQVSARLENCAKLILSHAVSPEKQENQSHRWRIEGVQYAAVS